MGKTITKPHQDLGIFLLFYVLNSALAAALADILGHHESRRNAQLHALV